MPAAAPPSWRIWSGLSLGVLAVSTAAILIRLAIAAAGRADPGFSLVLAASRLTVAALVLLPIWSQRPQTKPEPSALIAAIAAGLFLALHFAAWIISLSYTSIAAATTLVTTVPLWVTLYTWLWLQQPPNRLTWLGIGLALLGGMGVGLGETGGLGRASQPLWGNVLALVGAWMASLYFLLGRSAQRRGLSLNRYAAVAYTTAALVLLPLPPLLHTSYSGYSAQTYGYMLLLALVPQLVGHTSLNWSIRWLSPTLVTLAILLEPISASLLGYLIFGETPGPLVLAGAVLLLSGVAIAAVGHSSPRTT